LPAAAARRLQSCGFINDQEWSLGTHGSAERRLDGKLDESSIRGAWMITPQNDPNGALYGIYLDLAGRYHPDVVKGPRDIAEARFREIERAYEVMRDALREAPPVATTPKQNQSGSLSQSGAIKDPSHW
jgi:hypothetical protein